MKALIDSISTERCDIVYRVFETNQPQRYASAGPSGWNVIPCEYVSEVTVLPAEEAMNTVLGGGRRPLIMKYGSCAGEQVGWVGGSREYQVRFDRQGGVLVRGGGK